MYTMINSRNKSEAYIEIIIIFKPAALCILVLFLLVLFLLLIILREI